MKKIVIFAFVILGLGVTTSCSKFLEENNPCGLQTIYNTPEDLEAATRGVIGVTWQTHGIGGLTLEHISPASGLTTWGRTSRCNDVKFNSCFKFTQYSTTAQMANHFLNVNKGITAANTLIAALKDSPVDKQLKIEAEAEAKLYRAVVYFYLVRMWGDLSIHTEPLTPETATNAPRDPYYKVYEQIISDLEFAEKYMRDPERARQMSPTYPRPNKYAATAYLASVYNTIGSLLSSPNDNYWNPDKEGRKPDFSGVGLSLDPAQASQQAYAKALEYAEKLIPESSSHDAGCNYKLRTKFNYLFDWDGNCIAEDGQDAFIHDEQILSLPQTMEAGECRWIYYTMPNNCPGTSMVGTVSTTSRHVCTRWVFEKWCQTYPGKQHSSGDYYLDSSDPRFETSLLYGSQVNSIGTKVDYYPSSIKYNSQYSFPYFKKFVSKRITAAYDGDADFIFMRFAEVYLIAAEAAAALGQDAKAYKYIDVIHARARHSVADGMPDSAQPANWTGNVNYTGQELLDKIFWEWVFEFLGENFEFHNVHRHGANWIIRNICEPKNAFLDTPIAQPLFKSTDKDSFYPIAWKEAGSERYSTDPEEIRKGLLFAYPSVELLYNSALSADSQNDYNFGL